MSDDRRELHRFLRAVGSSTPFSPEDHLAPEVLIRYHAGELSAAEADGVRAHLVACGECSALLLEWAELPDPEPAREPIVAGEGAPRPHAAERRRPQRRRVAGRLLAAAVVLALLGLAFLTADLFRRLERQAEPQVNVAIYDLKPLADGLRTAGEGTRPVARRERGALLILHGAGDLDYPEFEIVLRSADRPEAAPLMRRRGLRLDPVDKVFTVALEPGYLSAGNYRIDLFGIGRGEPVPVAQYELQAADAGVGEQAR